MYTFDRLKWPYLFLKFPGVSPWCPKMKENHTLSENVTFAYKCPFQIKKRSLFCIHSGDKTPHKITSYFALCKNAFYYGKCSFHWWLSGPFWTGIIFNRVIVFVCLCVCESVPYNLKNCWPISMKFDRVIYIDKKTGSCWRWDESLW